jgi:DNA polymerase III epsilon subunit-like protein
MLNIDKANAKAAIVEVLAVYKAITDLGDINQIAIDALIEKQLDVSAIADIKKQHGISSANAVVIEIIYGELIKRFDNATPEDSPTTDYPYSIIEITRDNAKYGAMWRGEAKNKDGKEIKVNIFQNTKDPSRDNLTWFGEVQKQDMLGMAMGETRTCFIPAQVIYNETTGFYNLVAIDNENATIYFKEPEDDGLTEEQAEIAAETFDLLANPFVVMDFETTEIDPKVCDIVEIGIINQDGDTLLHQLIKPSRAITDGAYRKHGLSTGDLAEALTIDDFVHQLKAVIEDAKIIVAYNADYEKTILQRLFAQHEIEMPSIKWVDPMRWFAQWYGETRHNGDYRWQKLETAVSVLKVTPPEGGFHRAIGDCKATLGIIKAMAARHVDQDDEPDYEANADERDYLPPAGDMADIPF